MCGYEFICVVANEVDQHSHCQVRLLVLLQGLEHIDAGAAFERVIPLFGPVAIQEDISVDTLCPLSRIDGQKNIRYNGKERGQRKWKTNAKKG